jgi:CBS domain containing-hemolysin-like protein
MLEHYLLFSSIGIILSMLFSSAEISLIRSNPLQINVWKKQKRIFANYASYLIKDKDKTLILILIGINFSNVIASSFLTLYLIDEKRVNPMPEELIIPFISLIILVLAEVLPKTISKEYSNTSLLVLTPILFVFKYLFYPLILIFNAFNFIIKRLDNHDDEIKDDDERDDLEHVYKEASEMDIVEEDQKEMIENIFDFGEDVIEKIMTPKSEISSISIDDDPETILNFFIDSGHSKLCVYERNSDDIVGMISLYDLFDSPANIRNIIKDVHYISSGKKVINVVRELQSSSYSIGVVIDSNKKAIGIVTAEDIFEAVFGDFEDEYDIKDESVHLKKDGSYIINASMSITKFNESFDNIIQSEYESIAGYIINEIGRIPKNREVFFLSIGQVKIIKASLRKIEIIQLYINK